jgi:hypothetical protein
MYAHDISHPMEVCSRQRGLCSRCRLLRQDPRYLVPSDHPRLRTMMKDRPHRPRLRPRHHLQDRNP